MVSEDGELPTSPHLDTSDTGVKPSTPSEIYPGLQLTPKDHTAGAGIWPASTGHCAVFDQNMGLYNSPP